MRSSAVLGKMTKTAHTRWCLGTDLRCYRKRKYGGILRLAGP